MKIERILVPTDFSEASRAAIDDAIDLCRHFDAELHILHLYAPQLEYAGMAEMQMPVIDDFSEQFRAAAETRMQQLVEELAGKIEPVTHVQESLRNTADAIVAFADELPADLIVIGRHGHGMLERLLIGSTTERVVRHARQDVWVSEVSRD